jgi:hypothetical protein
VSRADSTLVAHARWVRARIRTCDDVPASDPLTERRRRNARDGARHSRCAPSAESCNAPERIRTSDLRFRRRKRGCRKRRIWLYSVVSQLPWPWPRGALLGNWARCGHEDAGRLELLGAMHLQRSCAVRRSRSLCSSAPFRVVRPTRLDRLFAAGVSLVCTWRGRVPALPAKPEPTPPISGAGGRCQGPKARPRATRAG